MKHLALFALVLLLLLAGCQSGPAESTPAPTPSPLPPGDETVATSPPVSSSTTEGSGTASFRDNLAIADQFTLSLAGVAPPPDGQLYQGWLIDEAGTAISVGTLPLDPDGAITLEWNAPNVENLLSRYSKFQITLEPSAGSASPTGQVVFSGELAGETLDKARRLFVKNQDEPKTPLDTAFALGLVAQSNMAGQHAKNAVNAAAIGTLPEMHAHLEHVINILVSADGPGFGDHDGNGTAQNPGDGFGAVSYARQIATLLENQEVNRAAAEVEAQITAVQEKCLEIIEIEDMATATTNLAELEVMIDKLNNEVVTNLYQAAQTVISFEISPGQ